jgi:hypothetical protein
MGTRKTKAARGQRAAAGTTEHNDLRPDYTPKNPETQGITPQTYWHAARWRAGGGDADHAPAVAVLPDFPDERSGYDAWADAHPQHAQRIAAIDPEGEAPNDESDGWHVYTVADAYAPRPPITYLVQGLLPLPSLSIVYAPPGDFKTMLMADLAAAVVAGDDWLPPRPNKPATVKRETTQAGVLWLDFDNGPRTMHERIEAVARARDLDPDDPLYYVSMPNPWLDASDFDSTLYLMDMVERLDVQLVIIDNLRDVSGRVEENSSEMGNVMSNFRRLAEDSGVAVVIIHHQRKSSGFNGRSGDTLRGHSSIEAALDLALLIEREQHANQVEVRATKVRGADVLPFGAVFAYDHKQGTTELARVRFYGVEVEDLSSDKAIRRTVVELVKETDALNKTELTDQAKEICTEAGVNRIRSQIDALVAEGKLVVKSGAKNAKLYYPPEQANEELHLV